MPRPGAYGEDSLGRALEIFVDPWTFALLREAYSGVRRFDNFQRELAISRNVLTKRLRHLVDNGIFERRRYQTRPPRYDYCLTEKGRDMYPIFLALTRWGDRWLAGPEGAPVLLRHSLCGRITTPDVVCSHCGEKITAREMSSMPGPGAKPAKKPADGVDGLARSKHRRKTGFQVARNGLPEKVAPASSDGAYEKQSV